MSDKKLEKILIIDDNADYRKLIKTFISKLLPGVETIEYDPVFEGIPGEDFDWSIYDVLLLDYHLSIVGTTGLDILQKNHKKTGFPATIMLTGAGTEEVAIRALKTGIYEYQPKQSLTKDKLKQSIIHAWEAKKSDRKKQKEITQHNRSFSKEVFYENLTSAAGNPDLPRVLVVISPDNVKALEEKIGIIGRDTLVKHIGKNSFDVFKLGACNPNITRISDTSIAVQIDDPANEKTLEFNMQGLCKHLSKCAFKFADEKYHYSVSIGVLKLDQTNKTAEELIALASQACRRAGKTEGNSCYIWQRDDEMDINLLNEENDVIATQQNDTKKEKEQLEQELKAATEAQKEATAAIHAEQEAKKQLEELLKAAAEAKAKAEAELKATTEAKAKAEAEAKLIKERQKQEQLEAELKANAKKESELIAEKEAREKLEAKIRAEAEAKLIEERQRQEHLEAELKAKVEAERQAREKLEAEIKAKEEAERQAREKLEAEIKAEAEAKAKAEAELRAEEEARQRREAEAKAEAELLAAKQAKEKLEAELKVVADARAKAEAEMNDIRAAKEKLEAELKAASAAKIESTDKTTINQNRIEPEEKSNQKQVNPDTKPEDNIPLGAVDENKQNIDETATETTPPPESEKINNDKIADQIRKLIEAKKIVQTYQPVIAMTGDGETEEFDIYKTGLMAYVDENEKINLALSSPSGLPLPLQQSINEWVFRQVFLRITESGTTSCPYRFLINMTEAWFTDIKLFDWLQKILGQTKKYNPGKSIILDIPLDIIQKHPKRTSALANTLHKTHHFTIVLSNIDSLEDIEETCTSISAKKLLLNMEQLKKLNETLVPTTSVEANDDESEKINMLLYLRNKGIRFITSGIEDATLLTDAITLGTNFVIGNFVGEIQDNLVESTTVESFELT